MEKKYKTRTMVGFSDQAYKRFTIEADTEFIVIGAETLVKDTFVLDVVAVRTLEDPPSEGIISAYLLGTFCDEV